MYAAVYGAFHLRYLSTCYLLVINGYKKNNSDPNTMSHQFALTSILMYDLVINMFVGIITCGLSNHGT